MTEAVLWPLRWQWERKVDNMRVVTAAEMRQIDGTAMEKYGIPGIVLMENAGLRVVEVVEGILQSLKGKVFTILVGKGNNGGDGLVVARHLLNRGGRVKVLLLADPKDFQGDAKTNLNIWQQLGQPVYQVNQVNGINILKVALLNTDMIIDALFGTGFRGPVLEKMARVIELVNASKIPVVSVDIPSGLEADSGQVSGPCIRAQHTVTFGLPKLGLLLQPGSNLVGQLHIVDISLPLSLLENPEIPRQLITGELVASWFKPRPRDSHKGTYGRVLVVAGSRGMVGAARMCTQAVLRAGAGLVTLAVPASQQPVAAASLDEAMTLGLPETEAGTLAEAALEPVLAACAKADILVLGPGLSNQPETVQFVRQLLPQLTLPTVLDADGLNALVGNTEILEDCQAPLLITPHPGEMGRLLELSIAEVQENRIDLVRGVARKWNLVAILKGSGTVIGTPMGGLYLNTTGNPGMATGGSGDVLTGVLAGLLAQGFSMEQAAAAGTYLHGLAGDMAAEELGEISLLAGDLIKFLPSALQSVQDKACGH